MSSNSLHNEFLKLYYNKIFPSDLFCKWLSLNDDKNLSKREFSFTLEGDVYVRYQSFENTNEFVKNLKEKNPHKIDIGAVYNWPPRNHKRLHSGALIPEWKEFVFDIDMTDYDDVRFCCEKADICNKCWTLMTAAMKVIDRALREDFGFCHILWVYSGRRGVHCWVSDKNARILKSNDRSALVSYLSLVKRFAGKKKQVTLASDPLWKDGLHPFIKWSIDIIRPYFLKYAIEDQQMLDNDAGIDRILDMLPPDLSECQDKLKNLWKSSEKKDEPQSSLRWKTLVVHLEHEHKWRVVDEIMLEILNPRLDVNVSIGKFSTFIIRINDLVSGVNHLLKSPFSVHPSTGKICVPIDIDNVDEFDPITVPTVEQVMQESGDSTRIIDNYIKHFEKFVSQLMDDEK